MNKNTCKIIDAIQARSSRRSYQPEALTPNTISRIAIILQNVPAGPFKTGSTFHLINKAAAANQKIKLGTYGFISGAQHFIVGKTIPGEEAFVDYGYRMEWIILQLTALGLGTCWLGGTFSRGEFARLVDLQKKEFIPAITPVGYATEHRSVRDRLIRLGAGSKNRKTWAELFFDRDFEKPLDEITTGKYAQVLEMVRRAPSASNKQPWRVIKADNAFHFYLQRAAGYNRMLPTIDLQWMDMGIALCHFELSASELHLNGKWQSFDPGLILPESTEYILSWV